jgi:hypothetical protein
LTRPSLRPSTSQIQRRRLVSAAVTGRTHRR